MSEKMSKENILIKFLYLGWMNCIVDQGVAVDAAEAGQGVVGVVADATVTMH